MQLRNGDNTLEENTALRENYGSYNELPRRVMIPSLSGYALGYLWSKKVTPEGWYFTIDSSEIRDDTWFHESEIQIAPEGAELKMFRFRFRQTSSIQTIHAIHLNQAKSCLGGSSTDWRWIIA